MTTYLKVLFGLKKIKSPSCTLKLLVGVIYSALRFSSFSTEPLKLYGEGEYNLDGIKKIDVTESYLGLNEDIRGCQNEEAFEVCTTRLYKRALIGKCHCLPFNINENNEVNVIFII